MIAEADRTQTVAPRSCSVEDGCRGYLRDATMPRGSGSVTVQRRGAAHYSAFVFASNRR